ncbi:MAG: NAD-dependent epimerase/dehydratase family protein [Phycisphaerae bacterium]
MTPPSILITGAPGWLGTRLVQMIIEGLSGVDENPFPTDPAAVRCLLLPGLDDIPIRAISDRIRITRGDLRDPDSLDRFCRGGDGASLFHCAGVVHPRWRARTFFDIHVGGVRNLLRAARKAGVRRLIAMSSNSPIGRNPSPDHVFDEDAPYHPYRGYGRSKMRMEDLLNEAHAAGAIDTTIIRSPWFYGPNQPPRQTTFFRMIRDGRFPIVGDGQNRRSMAYIDNICQGLLLAAASPAAAGRTYWIADARPYTMNEIITTVETALRRDFGIPVARPQPRLPQAVGALARALDGLIQRIGLYHQKVHVLSEMNQTIACTIDRARRELGYAPRIDLAEGMRRSIDWCLKKGFLERPRPAAGAVLTRSAAS